MAKEKTVKLFNIGKRVIQYQDGVKTVEGGKEIPVVKNLSPKKSAVMSKTEGDKLERLFPDEVSEAGLVKTVHADESAKRIKELEKQVKDLKAASSDEEVTKLKAENETLKAEKVELEKQVEKLTAPAK